MSDGKLQQLDQSTFLLKDKGYKAWISPDENNSSKRVSIVVYKDGDIIGCAYPENRKKKAMRRALKIIKKNMRLI